MTRGALALAWFTALVGVAALSDADKLPLGATAMLCAICLIGMAVSACNQYRRFRRARLDKWRVERKANKAS